AGAFPLIRVEAGDWLAELRPLERVDPGRVVGGLSDAESLRRDPDPTAVEGRHRDPEALALLVQKPVSSDCRTLDDNVVRDRGVESELLLVPRHPDVIAVEDEGADPGGTDNLGIGAREEQNGAGVALVRDPLLGAGDSPAVAVRLRACAKRSGVGARLGFREGERPEVLSTRKRRDEP